MKHHLPALEAFRSICSNEQYTSSRDMYPAIAQAGCALVNIVNHVNSVSFVRLVTQDADNYDLKSLVRAVYFLRLIRHRMPELTGQITDAWLKNKAANRLLVPAPFFHADIAPKNCHDDLAVSLGMTKGLDLSKVKQLLDFEIA